MMDAGLSLRSTVSSSSINSARSVSQVKSEVSTNASSAIENATPATPKEVEKASTQKTGWRGALQRTSDSLSKFYNNHKTAVHIAVAVAAVVAIGVTWGVAAPAIFGAVAGVAAAKMTAGAALGFGTHMAVHYAVKELKTSGLETMRSNIKTQFSKETLEARAGTVIKNIEDQITKSKDRIQTTLTHLPKTLMENMGGNLKALFESNPLIQQLEAQKASSDGIGDAASQVLDSYKEVQTQFQAALDDPKKFLEPGLKTAFETLAKNLETLAEQVDSNPAVSALLERINIPKETLQAFKTVATQVKDLVHTATESIHKQQELIQTLKAETQKVRDEFLELEKQTQETLKEFESGIDNLKGLAKDSSPIAKMRFFKSLAVVLADRDKITKNIKQIKELPNRLTEIRSSIKTIAQSQITLLTSTKEMLSTQLSALSTTLSSPEFKKAMGSLMPAFTSATREAASKEGGEIKEAASQVRSGVEEALLKALTDTINGAKEDIKQSLLDIARVAVKSVEEQVTEMKAEILGPVSKAFNQLKALFQIAKEVKAGTLSKGDAFTRSLQVIDPKIEIDETESAPKAEDVSPPPAEGAAQSSVQGATQVASGQVTGDASVNTDAKTESKETKGVQETRPTAEANALAEVTGATPAEPAQKAKATTAFGKAKESVGKFFNFIKEHPVRSGLAVVGMAVVVVPMIISGGIHSAGHVVGHAIHHAKHVAKALVIKAVRVAVNKAIEATTKQVNEIEKEILQKASERLDGLKSALTTQLDGLPQSIKVAVLAKLEGDSTLQSVRGSLQGLEAVLKDASKEVREKIEAVVGLKKEIVAMEGTLKQEFEEIKSLVTAGDDLGKLYTAYKLNKQLRQTATNGLEIIKKTSDLAKSIATLAKEVPEKLWEQLKEVVSEGVENRAEILQDIKAAVMAQSKQEINKVLQTVKDAALGLKGDVIGILDEKLNAVKDKVAKIINGIKTAVNKIKTGDFEDLLLDETLSVISGERSVTEALTDGVSQLAESKDGESVDLDADGVVTEEPTVYQGDVAPQPEIVSSGPTVESKSNGGEPVVTERRRETTRPIDAKSIDAYFQGIGRGPVGNKPAVIDGRMLKDINILKKVVSGELTYVTSSGRYLFDIMYVAIKNNQREKAEIGARLEAIESLRNRAVEIGYSPTEKVMVAAIKEYLENEGPLTKTTLEKEIEKHEAQKAQALEREALATKKQDSAARTIQSAFKTFKENQRLEAVVGQTGVVDRGDVEVDSDADTNTEFGLETTSVIGAEEEVAVASKEAESISRELEVAKEVREEGLGSIGENRVDQSKLRQKIRESRSGGIDPEIAKEYGSKEEELAHRLVHILLPRKKGALGALKRVGVTVHSETEKEFHIKYKEMAKTLLTGVREDRQEQLVRELVTNIEGRAGSVSIQDIFNQTYDTLSKRSS